MLRNLLYSLVLHITFVAFILLMEMDTSTNVLRDDVTPLTISFINDNSADEIKNLATKVVDVRVEELSITEKIDLYNKLKRIKNNPIKSNKVVYEESSKEPASSGVTHRMIAENEFSYYTTPVYVAENKINLEEKRKLIEDRLRKEELRAKIKERNIIPKVNIEDMQKTRTMEEIIQISQRPLVVKKEKLDDKKVDDKKVDDKQIANADDTKMPMVADIKPESNKKPEEMKTKNIDDLANTIGMAETVIDDKYIGLSEDAIFSEADYRRLKEIEDNKSDNKFLLSLREKKNIQRQIKGCYKMAILRSKKDSKAVVALTVSLDSDGVINMNTIKISRVLDNSDKESFDIALDNAKSALVFCSPLRGLPSGKYKTWRQMTFVFDSNNLE